MIDPEGKLRWARNNELVDTGAGKWKDLGDGLGIAPADSMEPPGTALHHRDSFSESTDSVNEANHYLELETRGSNRVSRMLKGRFTTVGLTDGLLRKTVGLVLHSRLCQVPILLALDSTEHVDLCDGMCCAQFNRDDSSSRC